MYLRWSRRVTGKGEVAQDGAAEVKTGQSCRVSEAAWFRDEKSRCEKKTYLHLAPSF